MKTNFLTYILIMILSYACTNSVQTKKLSTNNVINLDVASALSREGVAFENVVESIDKIITLQQNTADAIVAEILSYIVTDEYIYILDTYEARGVIIFDINGNFVTRIKRGEGPGEINAGYSIFYDNDENKLFVNDFIFIKEYTKEGRYVKSYPIDYPHIGGDIKDIQKNHYGFVAVIQTSYEESKIVQLDADMTILWETKLPYLPQELPKSIVKSYDSNSWIVRVIDNNIYKLVGDSIIINYHVDLKDYEHIVKNEYHGHDFAKHYTMLMRNIESGKYIFHNAFFCESEDYLSFSIWSSHNFTNICYNKTTKEIAKMTKEIGTLFYVISDNKPLTGNTFYGRISPERISEKSEWNWNGINPNNLLSDKDMATLKNAKPDDNPIIVIYKLKSVIKQ